MTSDIYKALAEPFDSTHKRNVGGVDLDYLTGEQVTTRLNTVLGVAGWSFEVKEHGYNEEADEIWVWGRLIATIDGVTVVREQFGSQKLKRSRASSTILDIGFDLKGGATDAMKKCASLIGVGLYLSHKEEIGDHAQQQAPPPARRPAPQQREQVVISGGDDGPIPFDPSVPGESATSPEMPPWEDSKSPPAARTSSHSGLDCAECGEPLKETRFKDGTVWSPEQLAAFGRRKHGRPLCMADYRKANDLLKQTQGA